MDKNQKASFIFFSKINGTRVSSEELDCTPGWDLNSLHLGRIAQAMIWVLYRMAGIAWAAWNMAEIAWDVA